MFKQIRRRIGRAPEPLTFRQSIALPTGAPNPAIVFVHGLSSDPIDTWGRMIAVCADDSAMNHHTLDCYAYPTKKIRLPLINARMATLQELADGLATELAARHAGRTDLTLVGHSLGGLIIRQYVLSELKAGRKLLPSRILLYAVPNNGATLASVGKLISWNHRHMRELCCDSSFLRVLNDDWQNIQVEASLPVHYVVGGADMIVTPDSARAHHGNKNFSTLINCDHRSIVQVNNSGDTSYLILREFILSGSSNLAESTLKPQITNVESPILRIGVHRPADPLFEIYSPEQEAYYLQRRFDEVLYASAIRHVWVSGPSGVGKTAALRRLATQAGYRLQQIMLASYQETATPLGLLRAICIELADQQGSGEIPDEDTGLSELITFFRRIVRAFPDDAPIMILIEEIPLPAGPYYSEFLGNVLQLLLALEAEDALAVARHQTVLAFSSVHHPQRDISTGMIKFRERIQFITANYWEDKEILALSDLITNTLQIGFSLIEKREIVAAAQGSPRYVKMVFHKLRSGHSDENLTNLLVTVASEQV